MLHLYYKTTLSAQIPDVVKSFEFCESLDISKIEGVKKDDVYFVEINNIEKNIILHIKNLLSNKTDSLIYFFIDDSQNLMLFQLATLLNVKNTFTPKHETQKIISSIKEDILLKTTTLQNQGIAYALTKNISFVIFKENDLVFASEKLLNDFKYKDLNMLNSNICSQIDLNSFLKNDINKEVSLKLSDASKKYNIKSITSKFNFDKYLFFEDLSQKNHAESIKIDSIKNRIYFIEMLKKRLDEKKASKQIYTIITIEIQNLEKLSQFWEEYEIEMAIRDMLLQVELELDASSIFAQYDNKLYLALLQGLDFEATKQKAQSIQTCILEYSAKQKIRPTVGLHVFDVNDFELNNSLKIISDISKDNISAKDIESQKLYKILNVDDELDDAKTIDMLLQASFTNKNPLKLLNIYKGLCINTASKIVKKTDEEIYVSFEQLQGIVMNFEKTTVIQSSCFIKDIEADVKLIDLNKKIALLKNFRFANGSANGRKYSRVTCSQRIPISIINNKDSLSGEILDISMNSIAIKTRAFKRIEELASTDALLKFILPVKSSQDGYMKLELEAKITFTKCGEDFCKIVVDLEQDQAHESILMEYVYNRQKEIIVELKKQTIIRS